MIALSVSEISTLGGFCDEDEDELGILVVGYEIQEQRAIHWENYCLYTIVLTPLIYKGHGVERGVGCMSGVGGERTTCTFQLIPMPTYPNMDLFVCLFSCSC